jgi:cell volume regulation protein A
MLILLLFDGGMHIGWRRFHTAAGPVLWIGVVCTVVTAVGVAVLTHLIFGRSAPSGACRRGHR